MIREQQIVETLGAAMTEKETSRMFLCTMFGLMLVGISLMASLGLVLRLLGSPWWAGFIQLPLGAGVGLLSSTIAAWMWKK